MISDERFKLFGLGFFIRGMGTVMPPHELFEGLSELLLVRHLDPCPALPYCVLYMFALLFIKFQSHFWCVNGGKSFALSGLSFLYLYQPPVLEVARNVSCDPPLPPGSGIPHTQAALPPAPLPLDPAPANH